MAINRADIAKQLLPGLNAIFGLEYGSVDNETDILFETENSDRAFEEEVLMAGFATAPTKSEGAAVQYDTAKENYTARYTHETVALAYAITEEAIEDNLYDTFAKIRTRALARAMANTKQTKGANIFNNAFNTAYLGGDGAAMCSNSHPTISDGDQDNLLAAADLFTAERILNSPGQTGGDNNDINAVNNMGLVPKGYYVNRRFTDANAYFILTDVPNGTKMFIRSPLGTKMEPDFDTGNLRFKARERYSFGWSDWRGIFGSAGSS
mgnify:CR=1 FL=1